MGIIGGIICWIVGAGCWWIDSSVTIYDPVLHTVVAASWIVFACLGIVFILLGALNASKFR